TVDPQPILRGGDAGRRVASVTDLEDGPAAFARIVQDEKETRLPKELRTWDGLRNEKNELFRFEDVRSLKSFRSLGGGIHMGNKASVETGSLAGASRMLLTYDVGQGVLLLRDIVDGRTLPLLEITPEELKALHGFAATERNLAVTIGWTGGSAPRDTGSGSTVLLDRYFVDTLVGQNLVVADKLPWSLDEGQLPNGVPNPVQEAFSKALADSLGELRRTIGDACRQALKAERDTKAWTEALGSGLRVVAASMQKLVEKPIVGDIPDAWAASFAQAQADWLVLSLALASVTSSDTTGFLANVKEIEGPGLVSKYFKTEVIRLQTRERASALAGEWESSKSDTSTPALKSACVCAHQRSKATRGTVPFRRKESRTEP
ncbi:MAG: hypothetical protein HOP15_01580, partial [Planctomycetes bacterium]|nr:hypothetical protein [Planctomycetota bacterium]